MTVDDDSNRSHESPVRQADNNQPRRLWAAKIGLASVFTALVPPFIVLGTITAFLADLPSPRPIDRLLIVGAFGITALIALVLGAASVFNGARAAGLIAIVLGALEMIAFFMFAGRLLGN
jgi:hypothetical protein